MLKTFKYFFYKEKKYFWTLVWIYFTAEEENITKKRTDRHICTQRNWGWGVGVGWGWGEGGEGGREREGERGREKPSDQIKT